MESSELPMTLEASVAASICPGLISPGVWTLICGLSLPCSHPRGFPPTAALPLSRADRMELKGSAELIQRD